MISKEGNQATKMYHRHLRIPLIIRGKEIDVCIVRSYKPNSEAVA
jgi:hypothetical protein